MALRLNWLGGLSAEAGGPCILGDTSSFPTWTASEPIPGREAKTLHLWGQFTAELPAKFRPNGKVGHQRLTYKSNAAAMAGLEELRASLKKKWPQGEESLHLEKNSAGGRFTLPDQRTMQIRLIEPNHYELMCGVDDLSPYRVSEKAQFLIFNQEGGGYVHVGQTKARDELVLMRWFVDEDEHEALVRKRVDVARKEQKFGTWAFKTNAAAVMWSPIAFSDLKGVTAAKLKSLAKAQKSFSAKGLSNVGFALTVKRGSYAVSWGHDEGDGWSALWCRLTLK